MLRENVVVLKELLRSFTTTGEICPTTRWGSLALCRPLWGAREPKSILEVGAGTGSITTHILKLMLPGDHLTACELNPAFVKELRRRLARDKNFRRCGRQVDFFCGPVQAMPADRKYDVLICSLPFLNFEARLAREILQKLLSISSPQAVMTYYEYLGLRRLNKALPLAARRRRLAELEDCFASLYAPRQIEVQHEWRNIMPIKIFTLNMAA